MVYERPLTKLWELQHSARLTLKTAQEVQMDSWKALINSAKLMKIMEIINPHELSNPSIL